MVAVGSPSSTSRAMVTAACTKSVLERVTSVAPPPVVTASSREEKTKGKICVSVVLADVTLPQALWAHRLEAVDY